jgi:hypothetical protein
MQDLAPCPWCKTNRDLDVVELHDQPGDLYVVACGGCGSIGPRALDAAAALARWDSMREPQPVGAH